MGGVLGASRGRSRLRLGQTAKSAAWVTPVTAAGGWRCHVAFTEGWLSDPHAAAVLQRKGAVRTPPNRAAALVIPRSATSASEARPSPPERLGFAFFRGMLDICAVVA